MTASVIFSVFKAHFFNVFSLKTQKQFHQSVARHGLQCCALGILSLLLSGCGSFKPASRHDPHIPTTEGVLSGSKGKFEHHF